MYNGHNSKASKTALEHSATIFLDAQPKNLLARDHNVRFNVRKFVCAMPDTIKMIADRAETAMTNIIREQMAMVDDARALIRDVFQSEADILPDMERRHSYHSSLLHGQPLK